MLKTARSYLHSSGHNTGTWRTDGRTEGHTESLWLLQRSALRAKILLAVQGQILCRRQQFSDVRSSVWVMPRHQCAVALSNYLCLCASVTKQVWRGTGKRRWRSAARKVTESLAMLNRLNGITAYTGSKPLRGGEGEGGGEREISTQPTLSWYHSTLYIFYLYVVFPISPGVSTLLLPCTLRQQKKQQQQLSQLYCPGHRCLSIIYLFVHNVLFRAIYCLRILGRWVRSVRDFGRSGCGSWTSRFLCHDRGDLGVDDRRRRTRVLHVITRRRCISPLNTDIGKTVTKYTVFKKPNHCRRSA